MARTHPLSESERAIEPAVAPSGLLRIFSLGIGAVHDQSLDVFERRVDCGRTLVDPDLMFGKTRRVNGMRVTKGLMIPGKEQGFPATLDSIAEIRDRVIHQHGIHQCIRDVERLRLGQRPKVQPSC